MEIEVKQLDSKNEGAFLFDVQVNEDSSSTRHTVTMDEDYYRDLKTDTAVEEIIRETFLFLLDREPKEMILSRFDITVVSHYFPEFEDFLEDRIS